MEFRRPDRKSNLYVGVFICHIRNAAQKSIPEILKQKTNDLKVIFIEVTELKTSVFRISVCANFKSSAPN